MASQTGFEATQRRRAAHAASDARKRKRDAQEARRAERAVQRDNAPARKVRQRATSQRATAVRPEEVRPEDVFDAYKPGDTLTSTQIARSWKALRPRLGSRGTATACAFAVEDAYRQLAVRRL